MNVKVINERDYVQMKLDFEKFLCEIRDICNQPEVKKDWLSNQDVCQILDISKRTLQYYRDSGKLSFSMIGNKCYYKISDVEKLISNSQTK